MIVLILLCLVNVMSPLFDIEQEALLTQISMLCSPDLFKLQLGSNRIQTCQLRHSCPRPKDTGSTAEIEEKRLGGEKTWHGESFQDVLHFHKL